MGKGGYHGGGTIIGWGARWSDWQDFPKPELRSGTAQPLSKRAKRRAKARAEAEAAQRWGQNLQPSTRTSKLTQEQLLRGLGLLPLPPKPQNRGDILKRLVAEGILLPTGRPNPDHPDVRAIEARTEKNT